MRRVLAAILLIIAFVIIYLVNSFSILISLLFEDASADAIHFAELPATNLTRLGEPSPYLIPRIIHQTYINESIPERWLSAQGSCLELHTDYKYILWTDVRSRAFIQKEYPWFLPTFDGYPYPIQRADSIRYFVLAYYGGTYLDLDQGCKRKLDPLLSYNAYLRQAVPTGISNDVMGSYPQHPFFLYVIQSLQNMDRNWVSPYITIMATTGPLFLSLLWKKWKDEHTKLDQETWPGRVHVLMPDLTYLDPDSFFQSYGGSSWHKNDARFIFWLGRNWMLLMIGGLLSVGFLVFGLRWAHQRLFVFGTNETREHRKVNGRSMISRNLTVPLLPLWRKWSQGEARRPVTKTSRDFGGLHNA